jgi:hypothetical protein
LDSVMLMKVCRESLTRSRRVRYIFRTKRSHHKQSAAGRFFIV